MSDWTNFSDDEIILIKNKLDERYTRALKLTMILSIPMCLLAPFIPSRKSHKRLIDTMDYENAVIMFSIFWIICLIGVSLFNKYKVQQEYNKLRKHLIKKKVLTVVKSKKKGVLKRYDDKIYTTLKDEFKILRVEKCISEKLESGDSIEIEFEEKTMTILRINKIETGTNIALPQ